MINSKESAIENMIIDKFSKLKFVDKVEVDTVFTLVPLLKYKASTQLNEKKCTVIFKTRKKHDKDKTDKLESKALELIDELPSDCYVRYDFIPKGGFKWIKQN